MPKVIHVLRKFEPAAWGGIETHLAGLLPALAAEGWDSHVMAPLEAGTDARPLTALGASFSGFRAHYPYLGMSKKDRDALVSCGGNLVSFDALWQLLQRHDADVLHVHTQGRLGGIVRTAARVRGVPCAVTLHGPVRSGTPWQERHGQQSRSRMLDIGKPFGWMVGARTVVEDADLVYVLNEPERAAWSAARAGRHLRKIRHGIEPSRVNRDDRAEARARVQGLHNNRYALMLGRLDPAKGQDVAVEAFLRGAPSDAHLVIAGAPTDAAWAARIATLAARAPERIHLIGGVPQAIARALLAECSVALIPSSVEPFGLVLLEAWAEGAPTFASGVDGLQELMKEAGAFECAMPSGDVQAWADKIACLLGREDARLEAGVVGPARAAAFSWSGLARTFVEDYQRAIDDRRYAKEAV